MIVVQPHHAWDSISLLCSFAIVGLIVYVPIRPRTKRLLLATVFALALVVVGVYAAEIVDPCSKPPFSEMTWWERAFFGCF